MDNEKILASIKTILDGAGMDSAVVPPDDIIFHPRLVVFIGNDRENRERILEITAQSLEVDKLLTTDEKEKAIEYVRIQVDTKFPFKVEDKAMADVAQFLHVFNLQIDVPGFYLNYYDNAIIYRYVLMAEREHIPIKILFSIIGTVLLFQDLLSSQLERLATGKVSFVYLLKEIHEALNKMKI